MSEIKRQVHIPTRGVGIHEVVQAQAHVPWGVTLDALQSQDRDIRLGSIQRVLRSLPGEAGERKAVPITTGVLDYFPLAVAEVARLSKIGNDQHNPGQPLHWARGRSADHADCLVRHLLQRGELDSDGVTHTAKVAWRALALLQEELEAKAGYEP